MNRPDFTVADLGELVTLITTEIVEGANVWVDTDGAYWTLEKNSGVAPGPTVLAPLPGAPQAGATNARWLRNVGGGGGGGVTGDPNSIVFENPTGTAAITDPNFVAAPLDPQGRPMIRDKRVSPINGRGAIWRQGSWPIDGDPGPGVKGEGFVSIGANSLNLGPDSVNGAFFLATPGSFGIAQIIAGVNGGNCFYPCGFEDASVDNPAFCPANLFVMNDDTAVTQFQIDRMTGRVLIGDLTKHTGDLYINQGGPIASGSPVGMSQITRNSAINLRQYGAAAFTSNIGFFRSRGTVIGPLATPGAYASVAVGDSLMNLTAQAVTANNTDTPLAAIFDAVVPATGLFAQSVSPDFRWALAGPNINDHRVVWSMIGMSGDLVMGAFRPTATEGARIKIDETSRNAMQGVVTLGAGGTFPLANTLITANTRIQLTWQDGGPNPAPPAGNLYPTARAAGVGFTIASTGGAADAGINVFWQLWEPAP